jgi:hypothetical protein
MIDLDIAMASVDALCCGVGGDFVKAGCGEIPYKS